MVAGQYQWRGIVFHVSPPGMYGMFITIEAVRQLRGECGGGQNRGGRMAMADVVGAGSAISVRRNSLIFVEQKDYPQVWD